MAPPRPTPIIQELRDRIRRIERAERPLHAVLPFGVAALDARLPGGGLAAGALHEVAGGGLGAVHGAAAALFAAGILARRPGPVLWCLRARDLFAPALAQAGLHPDRVIYAEAGEDAAVLLVMEEGLRHGGLAGVVGETGRLDMTASRRLQLAAEASGVPALAVRRWRSAEAAADYGTPTAAVSRWRITAQPSSPMITPGIGRAHWQVELLRCRGGEPATWILEACDAQGRLAVPAELADRSAAPAEWRHAATG